MKILLVDDNKAAREMLKLILGNVQNKFSECDDGKDATEAYAGFMPDFVMMDIKMKEVDGFAATVQILKKFPDAKVFIVSDYTGSDFEDEARRIGALKFISKENLTVLPALLKHYN